MIGKYAKRKKMVKEKPETAIYRAEKAKAACKENPCKLP